MARLTQISVDALKPPTKGQKTYTDDVVPGFAVRVSQGGTKTYIVQHGTDRRKKTIGRHGVISLADARKQARSFLASLTLGQTEAVSPIFAEALPLFLELHCARHNKPSTALSTRKLLENNCLPHWKHKPVHTIRKADISFVLDKMIARGSPGASNNCYSAISKFFSWCVSRGMTDTNPATGVQRPSRLNTRDRVLTDNELATIWEHTDYYPFGHITRLLMLTGARRNEVASMQWDWISDDYITVPATHTKNSREHIIPLTSTLSHIIDAVPRTHDKLFPARGAPTNPFSGFSKCKKRLDAQCPMPYWTLHDLRRSTATHMAQLGVQPHIVEAVLNHASGTISGVAGVYNRYAYFDEKRDALNQWHAKIRSLV